MTASWVVGAGVWNSAEISARGLFPPGAPVAASQHFGAPVPQTDVFVVDNSGRLNALWVLQGGGWNGPIALSPAGKFKTGAYLAASQ